MKRPRFGSRSRVSRDVSQLSWLAQGLARSGSKLEDSFWESRLAREVDGLLKDNNEDDLTAAIDRLFDADPRSHDELADMVEARAEFTVLEDGKGQACDILLLACPILAWSRYGIPAQAIPKATLDALRTHLLAHVLAADARLALVDFLYSPDQLPRSYCDTHALTCELGALAMGGRDLKLDPSKQAETNRFLSDTRYLIGAVAVPRGSALFRWHEGDSTREKVLEAWTTQGAPNVEPLLAGCAFQIVLPDAYHAACREADRLSRPYSIQASVAFLASTLGTQPASLKAVIGPFHDHRLEEYRIALGPGDQEAVYHGVVWPLLGNEDENTDLTTEIESVLKACGVGQVIIHEHRFPLEFCDDCGAPLYANGDGELVHAEMPEDLPPQQALLH